MPRDTDSGTISTIHCSASAVAVIECSFILTTSRMKINDTHQYHGAALAQIVQDDAFTALNRASDQYGHYQINHDRRVLIKTAKNNGEKWSFTFTQDHLAVLRNDINTDSDVFACLVCGTTTICLLTVDDLQEVIDLNGTSQTIHVRYPPKKSMRVWGSKDELSHVVYHKAFPRDIF